MNWTDSCTIHIQWRGVTVSEGRHRTQDRREDRELWVAVPRSLYLTRPLTTFAGDILAEFRPEVVDDPLDSVQQIAVRR